MIATLFHKAYITLGYILIKKKLTAAGFILAMLISQNISSQSFLGLYPFSSGKGNDFRVNSLEENSANFSGTKDWELAAVFGGKYSDRSSSFYLISLAKKFDRHYFYTRYTPGIQKEIFFNNGAQILDTRLQTRLEYKETFGFGYSFNLTENLSAGFSMRYFEQNFENEEPVAILTDSINYIITGLESAEYNFWKGDLGLNYSLNNELSFSASSNNLFISDEISSSSDLDNYSLRKDKTAMFGIAFFPSDNFFLQTKVETNSSFLAGIAFGFSAFGNRLNAGLDFFHDKYQQPFLAGFMPSLRFSNDFLSVVLSGVKYFSSQENYFVQNFRKEGIANILNNPYSEDKILLGVNVALSFTPEQKVKFIDIEILKEIYPTLHSEYSSEPFAMGKAVNLSDETLSIRPSSFIAKINEETVYSPEVKAAPGDTAEIPFYTLIASAKRINKREIAHAQFFISTGNKAEDEINKPILINDKNSWNGKVSTLKYFVKENFDYSSNLAKQILNEEKEKLENINPDLEKFLTIKILFNNFVEELLYVSDPRAATESVQFLTETIHRKGGDCDDLSVGFSSLLESVGIQTAFVDYKSPDEDGANHVNLLVNTGLKPERGLLITGNDSKYIVRKNSSGKDEIWIPVETTSLSDFELAWEIASEKFNNEAIHNLGLAKGEVTIVDIL